MPKESSRVTAKNTKTIVRLLKILIILVTVNILTWLLIGL